jgi:AcrR family transcriptional regulator
LGVENESLTVTTRPPTRREQRDNTRLRILGAAVTVLIERGVARTTTLEVQQQAGVGRGTLLHHFSTHSDLLAATVVELVRQNEANVDREARRWSSLSDPLARAIRTLADAAAHPSYLAELELWVVARTDDGLRDALRAVEREALHERDRVLADLFEAVADKPGHAAVVGLSIEFARGLALSGILRTDPKRREHLLRQWLEAAMLLLDHRPATEGR